MRHFVGLLCSLIGTQVHAQNCASITVAAAGTASCIVPSDVSRLSYVVVGGNGGTAGAGKIGSGGGKGAQILGEIVVTPGQTYLLTVGTNGHNGSPTQATGGGGGGYSSFADIINTPLMVAAGGGGGGGSKYRPGGDASAAAGGLNPGQPGAMNSGGSGGGGSGGYGAGGAGGNFGMTGMDGADALYGGGGGGGAGFGQSGGSGGTAIESAGFAGGLHGGGGGGGGSNGVNAPAGGGGGGGYAGGGGGGYSSGGGAGSSFAPVGATLGLGDGAPRIVLRAVLPTVAPTVSHLASNSATLNASVNAQWANVTNVFFRYGLLKAAVDDDTAPTAAAMPNTLAAGSNVTTSANLSSLIPGATYYFRAYATNAGGTASTATSSFTTAKLAQPISWGAAPTALVGSAATLSAIGGASGQPVIFSSLTPAECTVSGNQVTGLRTGNHNCTVAANQAGNSQYDAAAQVTQTLSVAAAPASVVSVPSLSQWGVLLLSALLGGLALRWRRRA